MAEEIAMAARGRPALAPGAAGRRLRLSVRGTVQGVGFRPFVHRRATALGLTGWVLNGADGVAIEIEGPSAKVDAFLDRFGAAAPPMAEITDIDVSDVVPLGGTGFAIGDSVGLGRKSVLPPVDVATCDDCLAEIFDPASRRFRYPFTSCANCGPRYSIVDAMPFDRPNTSMAGFAMCPECRGEYSDPDDRRFHAQTSACPVCGPQLALLDRNGRTLAVRDDALRRTVDALRAGRIVAVKGLGGFHLMVDAGDAEAVSRLRVRKHRPEKPFAVMFPSLDAVEAACDVTAAERALLVSPQTPIVLLARRNEVGRRVMEIADGVAPGNPMLGVMLPCTPLHHLLLADVGAPVVATSGNLSDEPVVIDNGDALTRLSQVADLFLVHDRPIVRPVDDSVVRIVDGEMQLLRSGRGYAPYAVPLHGPKSPRRPSVLAVGAHLKNTVAMTVGDAIVVSQHVGDLGSPLGEAALEQAAAALGRLQGVSPEAIACDMHPDYGSTRFAERAALPRVTVQHHVAHVMACMAEHGLAPPVLGVAWDGTGYGPDGTVWGGEFLLIEADSWRRVGHLHRFSLPGGERAVREPRRAALGLLYALFGTDAFTMDFLPPVRSFPVAERHVIATALAHGINAPATSSAGRLFDGVAALLGLCQRASYEGQAACTLEWAIADSGQVTTIDDMPTKREDGSEVAPFVVDWRPAVRAIVAGVERGEPSGRFAAAFHDRLAEAIADVARHVGVPDVVLTGGCFQNAALTTRTVARLRASGLQPFRHRRVPPGDGGIAVGQAAWAVRSIERG